jgi:hypothetical protein
MLFGYARFLKQPEPLNANAIIRELTEMPAEREAILVA